MPASCSFWEVAVTTTAAAVCSAPPTWAATSAVPCSVGYGGMDEMYEEGYEEGLEDAYGGDSEATSRNKVVAKIAGRAC